MTDGPDRATHLLVIAVCICGVVAAGLVTPQQDGGDLEPAEGDVPNVLELVLQFVQWLYTLFQPEPSVCTVDLDDPQPTPGEQVTVRVERAGAPVANARVSFNGEFVGVTDERGTVTGEVPYEPRLDVGVEMPSGVTCRASTDEDDQRAAATPAIAQMATVARAPLRPPRVRPLTVPLLVRPPTASSLIRPPARERTHGDDTTRRPSAVGAAGPHWRSGSKDESATTPHRGASPTVVGSTTNPTARLDGRRAAATNESFDVADTVNVEVSETPYPGRTVTLTARIGTTPMRNATVTADDRRVGRTDEDGQLRFRVPDDGTRRVEVRVRRGNITGSETIRVAVLTVSVRTSGYVTLPGDRVTVVTEFAGDRPADANVAVAGEPVGSTDVDGELRIRLPANPLASVTASARGQYASTTVLGVYLQTAFAVVGVSVLAVALLGFLALVALWLVGAVDRETLASLAEALLVALRSVAARLEALVVALVAWLRDPSVPDLRGLLSRGPDEGATAGTGEGRDSWAEPSGLREQWRTLARWVAPRRWRRLTPGAVRDRATEAGYPDEAVSELTEQFQAVEYGGRPLTESRRRRARTAFETVAARRERTEGDDS